MEIWRVWKTKEEEFHCEDERVQKGWRSVDRREKQKERTDTAVRYVGSVSTIGARCTLYCSVYHVVELQSAVACLQK